VITVTGHVQRKKGNKEPTGRGKQLILFSFIIINHSSPTTQKIYTKYTKYCR